MPAGDWNFMAGVLDGDGNVEIIETELPIEIESIDRTLSAPPSLSGTITNKVRRFKKAGRPIFEPWSTVILAVADENIRGMGIYRSPEFNGDVWNLDVVGVSGYPQGMPYIATKSFANVDPLDIHRYVWDHLQAIEGGNLGVTLDRDTKTPIRVGAGTTSDSDDPPRTLTWWETLDLQEEIDALSSETPYDWIERNFWDDDGLPRCHIGFGYPEIGVRQTRNRLVLGENLAEVPGFGQGDNLTGVHVLGAGEGRARIHGKAGGYMNRVRRVVTVDDQNFRTQVQADKAAQRELAANQGQFIASQVDVFDHPNLRLAAVELGNEYPLYADTDWAEVDQFVRVVGISTNPLEGDRATLTVVRSEVV